MIVILSKFNVSGLAETPTGTVNINDGEGASCIATLTSGAGSCSLTSTDSGSKTLTANYSGNSTYAASNDTEEHTVNMNISTTTITSDEPDPSTEGLSYTVAVTVSGSAGTPTGSVSVNDGEGGECTIGSLSGGSGSCSMNSPSGGEKTLTATYSGDISYLGSNDTEAHMIMLLPGIDVRGNSVSITDGDSTPSLSDHTNFGGVFMTNGTLTRTFTIYNSGDSDLNLSGNPKVVLGGPNALDFNVRTQPDSPVAPSGPTSFIVVCDPSAVGLRTATLSIANDDSDKNPFNFSIQCTGLIPPTPSIPQLVSPLNALFTNDNTPTFTWNSVPHGVDYQIQISISSAFTGTLAADLTVSESSYTPSTPLADAKYYWRVRVRNSVNAYSSWSAARSLSIDILPPPAPVLGSPAADASVAGTPAFSWLAAAGANAYQFEYDDDPGFGSPNYTSAVLTTLTHKPPTIPLGSFYWHVRSRDAAGNWSAGWSAPRMITITPPKPVAPLLASPLNASFTNDSTPTFTWNSVPYGVDLPDPDLHLICLYWHFSC